MAKISAIRELRAQIRELYKGLFKPIVSLLCIGSGLWHYFNGEINESILAFVIVILLNQES